MHQAFEAARDEGLTSVVVGMDIDHILPGVIVEMTELRATLESLGFSKFRECFDLERDLAEYVVPTSVEPPLKDARATVRPCTIGDIPELKSYLAESFPGRWTFDVTRKVELDDEPDDVYVLAVDGRIQGHAMTQTERCKRPIGGAVWNLDLGPNWAALGSIGIAAAIRGRGLGNALLGKSLQALREKGARRTIIDWTDLVAFYGAHGFEVSRNYVQMEKCLELRA